MDKILRVFQKNVKALFAKSGVEAVGIGKKTVGGIRGSLPAIVCSVDKKLSFVSPGDFVPQQIKGVLTDVIETGVFVAPREVAEKPTDRIRPAPGGVSIGHVDITAGTLGCLVIKNGEVHILSNNHVLANSNMAEIGDMILQPGRYDGGVDADVIAKLSGFVPIIFDSDSPPPPIGCPIGSAAATLLNVIARLLGSETRMQAVKPQDNSNLVDAAIALPALDMVDPRILEIGIPTGVGEAILDMPVKKHGRTTLLTEDTILQTNVTVRVSYGDNKVAVFVDQLMAGAMSQGGDSGSAVLDMLNKLVGLLFAGSNAFTIINPIQHVFDGLGIDDVYTG